MGPQFNEGEIAITTNTKFSENRGKVVRLKEYLVDAIGQNAIHPSTFGWSSVCVAIVICITSTHVSATSRVPMSVKCQSAL